MRDNHEGMPELLEPLEESSRFFAHVQLERGDETRRFRFEVTRDGYLALMRMRQARPFDHLPGAKYRYFFAIGIRDSANGSPGMTVRVEQGRSAKQIDFEAPKELVANLEWFRTLDDWNAADHLERRGYQP